MHIWLVLALSVCSVFIAGGQSADTPTLTPGIAVEGALSGAQSHAYQIALDAGQFVAVAIRRTLNYPIVTFADPSGRKILEDPQADTVLIAQLMGVRRAKPAAGGAAAPSELYVIPNRRRLAQVVSLPVVWEMPLRYRKPPRWRTARR